MQYLSIFYKRFNKPCVDFLRVWTKNKSYWKIWEKFRNFSKNLLRKMRKCIILAYFSKNLTNYALIFRAFGRKTQIVGKCWENFEIFWWKFNRKIAFLIIFGKFVTKNRAFGNNTIFLQQFFGFGGIPPLATPLEYMYVNSCDLINFWYNLIKDC